MSFFERFTQLRAFGKTAQDTLATAGASADAVLPALRDVQASTILALNTLLPVLPIANLPASVTELPLSKYLPNDPIKAVILEYVGGILADLADERLFDKALWEERALGNYLRWFVGGKEDGRQVATQVLDVFIEADKVRLLFFRLNLAMQGSHPLYFSLPLFSTETIRS